MKRTLFSVACLIFAVSAMAWSIKGDKIKTEWAEKVTPENAWQNYPRPQLKRTNWTNLNGLWKYAVTETATQKNAVKFEDQILVPFAIESALSGVAKTFTPNDKLWYRREFTLDAGTKGMNTILHFGAVDYECTIWVNNKLIGSHKGGNNPFSFDITKYLKSKGTQVLELSVIDPTDKESITRGKQQLNQFGIWYTPVSGIWQTVWLESVNPTHIKSVLPETDITKNTVNFNFDLVNLKGNELLEIKVIDNGKVIASTTSTSMQDIQITIPNPVLWSPLSPKLYNIEVELTRKNTVIDYIESYFAMREVSMQKDNNGYNRIFLNGSPIFNYGTLDQGWWPDGLLTPPSAEAMLWDMIQLKEMGFNTIRKHIKVEPALYYYYADSLGLMLWQDMPSGFATERKEQEHIKANAEKDWDAPKEVADQWLFEINEMIDVLRFFPSITTWVVFNEGWGQHDTKNKVNMVMQKDPSRLTNGVSGWTDRNVGHMHDVHNYPLTSMIKPAYNKDRISVLGEFGGLGMALEGHLWNSQMRNWGYKNMDGSMDFVNDYAHLIYDLETLVAQGLAAAIYTQTTDVEGEVNGLITYDRKAIKIPSSLLHMMHSRLYNTPSVNPSVLIADGQGANKLLRKIEVNGVSQNVQTPFTVRGASTVRCKENFQVSNNFNNLSLWLKVNGVTKIWINGKKVVDLPVRNTRQYNQFNLSDYVQLLKPGQNTFEIEVVMQNNNAQMDFDFGLTAY